MVTGSFYWVKSGRGVSLFFLAPGSSMGRGIPWHSVCACWACNGTAFTFSCTFDIFPYIFSWGWPGLAESCRDIINTFLFTFCWLCISVYLSQYLTNLMHKICFTISLISCLYMFRAHVPIIRRSKLHYTASGIIKPIGVMIPEADLLMMGTCARNM